VRATVFILGTNLQGATSVNFDGVAAALEVVSSTEITTTVPEGATTGPVQVTTPSGALTSNVPFQVAGTAPQAAAPTFSVPGGTYSAAKTLTLTNYLSSPLSINWSITGTNASDFAIASTTCTSTLGTGTAPSSCTYSITFAASANGAESATFTVTDADGTQTATLKGTGVGAAIAPTTLTFAAQTKGTTSAAKTLTLSNYLSSSLSIAGTAFGGANPGDFAIASTTCTSPLAGTSTCTYSITFTPSLVGAESATFSVTDADGTQTATLKGTGK